MLSTVVRFVCCLAVCGASSVVLLTTRSTALAAPAPTLADAPTPTPDETPQVDGDQVAQLAEHYVGSRYVWGGISPAGFDCTGFVLWVYAQFGISLPHNEAGQLASGPQVSLDDLQPGDVLVFANTYRRGLSHTGIYLGDGRFVHAEDERHGVVVSDLWGSYWAPHLVGASRDVAAA